MPEIEPLIRGARRVLIASDFDGTLCPIATSPAAVRFDPGTTEVLTRLASSQRVAVAVITGRALADIRSRVPLKIALAGNHGLEIAGPGFSYEHPLASELRSSLLRASDTLRRATGVWAGAWVEDKRLSATLHFRNVELKHHDKLITAARRSFDSRTESFVLRAGNRVLDVIPKLSWNKGRALRYIQERTGPFDITFCFGDDRTDESMFRANRGQFSIRVGRKTRSSKASYYLDDSKEVAEFLSHMVTLAEYETVKQHCGIAQATAVGAPTPVPNWT